MKSLKLLTVIMLAFAANFAAAKLDVKSNLFRNGDRACFVGDSITAGGWFTDTAMLYYATRLPETKIDFRNIGISGDSCAGIIWRMDWDVLPQLDAKRGVSILMIGMNDVGRNKFGKAKRAKLGEEQLQKQILSTRAGYEKNLSQIVDVLSANSRGLVVFTPSIYDQTAQLKTENLFGVNDELAVFGKIGVKLAGGKNNTATVDMNSYMSEINARFQEKLGKDKTIVGADRVHPRFAGALVMLDKWLSAFKEPSKVAEISVDAKSKAARGFNCEISNVVSDKRKTSFAVLEHSLPFPVEKGARNVLEFIDFQKNFNVETLKVSRLAKGEYLLKIDGKVVGKYSVAQLAAGVNLAENEKTPQYKQAEAVAKRCLEFRSKAAGYRSFYMLELFNRNKTDKLDVDGKIAFMQKKLNEETKAPVFMKNAYSFYIKNKKKQKALSDELFKINAEIYAAAKPVSHKYEIVPAPKAE